MKPVGLFLILCFLSGLAWAGVEKNSVDDNSADTYSDRAMLGVSTASVSPSLQEYLGLEPGFGIQIHAVVAGTPAAESGLQQKDILVRLGDQRLISPEHLSLLVNSRSPGDSVELHLIRRGERKSIEVILGAWDSDLVPTGIRPDLSISASSRPHPLQNEMRKQQEIWEEWMKNRNEVPEGGAGQENGGLEKPNFPIHIFGKEGIVTIDNPGGSITFKTAGGETTITIRDAEDEVVHEGLYDPEKGVEGLPEEARDHLKKMRLDSLSRFALPEMPRKKILGPPLPVAPPRAL